LVWAGPGGKERTPQAVHRILTNPVYAGMARFGETAKGKFHRLIAQQITEVEPGAAGRRLAARATG
jgi:hypothetical protein